MVEIWAPEHCGIKLAWHASRPPAKSFTGQASWPGSQAPRALMWNNEGLSPGNGGPHEHSRIRVAWVVSSADLRRRRHRPPRPAPRQGLIYVHANLLSTVSVRPPFEGTRFAKTPRISRSCKFARTVATGVGASPLRTFQAFRHHVSARNLLSFSWFGRPRNHRPSGASAGGGGNSPFRPGHH